MTVMTSKFALKTRWHFNCVDISASSLNLHTSRFEHPFCGLWQFLVRMCGVGCLCCDWTVCTVCVRSLTWAPLAGKHWQVEQSRPPQSPSGWSPCKTQTHSNCHATHKHTATVRHITLAHLHTTQTRSHCDDRHKHTATQLLSVFSPLAYRFNKITHKK